MKIGTWLVVVCGIVCSCNSGLQDDPIIVADVDDEFVVNLFEVYTPDQRELQFKLSSLSIQECRNYTINNSLNVYDDRIILNMQELVPPSPSECETGRGTANAVAEVGMIEDGVFDLQMNIRNDIVNRGKLIVDEMAYRINLESKIGITIPELVLNRLPENTILGCVKYDNADLKATTDTLLQRLTEQTNEQVLSSGNYGYFKVEQNRLVPTISSSKGYVQLFQANYKNLQPLLSIIQQYRNAYGNQLQLSFFTTEGNIL